MATLRTANCGFAVTGSTRAEGDDLREGERESIRLPAIRWPSGAARSPTPHPPCVRARCHDLRGCSCCRGVACSVAPVNCRHGSWPLRDGGCRVGRRWDGSCDLGRSPQQASTCGRAGVRRCSRPKPIRRIIPDDATAGGWPTPDLSRADRPGGQSRAQVNGLGVRGMAESVTP